jgi:hypothetical protein
MAYKNPPSNRQFQKGESGNPKGKTSEQRKAEIRNAELATKIRTRLLEAVQATLQEDTSTAAAIERIEGNILKLIKESEDRGLGMPKASVDLTSEDGTMTPRAPLDMSVFSTETLAEIMRAFDAQSKRS